MLSTLSVLLPVLLTFTCHPVGGPIVPSATAARKMGLALVPHTGADAASCKIVPSALLNPASATGAFAGQNAVATPVVTLGVDTVALAIVNVLSLDADVDRHAMKAGAGARGQLR